MLFRNLPENQIQTTKGAYDNIKTRLLPDGLHGCYFEVFINPFGNCQNFIISWFNFFLRYTDNIDEFIDNLKYCNELAGKKKILVIDISNEDFKKLQKYIKESPYTYKDMLMFRKSYVSTNGSNMNLIQLNLFKTIQQK